MNYVGFGSDVREIRDKAELTQEAFARRLKKSGSYISAIESNGSPLTRQVLNALVKEFGEQGARELELKIAQHYGRQSGATAPEFEWTRVCIVYRFDNGRVPAETREYRRVRALVDGLTEVIAVHKVGPQPGVPEYKMEFEVTYGGVVTEFVPQGGGYVHAVVRLPGAPLAAGDERTIWTRRWYVGKGDPLPYWIFGPGDIPAHEVTVCVQFAPTAVPAKIWAVENLFASRLPPVFDPERELSVSDQRSVEYHFSTIPLNRVCGLAWQWEDD